MDAQKLLSEALKPVAGQRRGQSFMNFLARRAPDLYDALADSRACNPFYDDDRLPAAVALAVRAALSLRPRP